MPDFSRASNTDRSLSTRSATAAACSSELSDRPNSRPRLAATASLLRFVIGHGLLQLGTGHVRALVVLLDGADRNGIVVPGGAGRVLRRLLHGLLICLRGGGGRGPRGGG